MANQTCTQMLQVHHMRVVRLDDDFTPLVSPTARYEHTRPVSLDYTEQRPDRVTIEQLDGAGDRCGYFQGPERPPDTVEMNVGLCKVDAELQEMLAGGSTITDGTYGTIGYLAATQATVNINGVGIETWSLAWNGNQRWLFNGQPAWYRHLFPKTSWRVGQVSMANDSFSLLPLEGVGEVNSQWDTGWDDDPFPVPVGNSAYGWVLDDEIPTGACGYQVIAA